MASSFDAFLPPELADRSAVSATGAEPSRGPDVLHSPVRRPVRRRAVAAPAPPAEQALAERAAEILRARAGRAPARWQLPGFARDVDAVRRQLGPLRNRAMLVASFERESARRAPRGFMVDPAAPPPALGPLEAGYAVRWLELGDGGLALPPWAALVAPETDSPE